tara:strand:+ start:16597 stop:17010 length:414 start_codon:yes stop_codon:yes gene_type:complete
VIFVGDYMIIPKGTILKDPRPRFDTTIEILTKEPDTEPDAVGIYLGQCNWDSINGQKYFHGQVYPWLEENGIADAPIDHAGDALGDALYLMAISASHDFNQAYIRNVSHSSETFMSEKDANKTVVKHEIVIHAALYK